jgi:NitT/TauT family transport system ATP-binding protein
MLSLIAGILLPSSGTIDWDEKQLQSRDQAGRRLAMLFQRDTVLPWRVVEKNVQFGMSCLSLSRAERREWTETLLSIADLQDFRKAYPKALSGGMRRRVGLLMSLSVRPAVLLLDEPFGALDEPTRVGLLGDVLRLVHQYDVSVVLVTHDLGEAISVADRIVVVSARPATVLRVVNIGFGRDRDVFSVRETEEYARLYGDLWGELRSIIRGNSGQSEVLPL